MNGIIDISVPLSGDTPIWPGSVGLTLSRISDIERGDGVTVSRLDCDVHVGTHVDAPRHFVEGGQPIENLNLETLVGSAIVVDLPYVEAIDAVALEGLKLPGSVERLLFRTRNSALWASGDSTFRRDYVALTTDGARWVVDHGIRLVGIDYLSIQRFTDDSETHRILLRAGIVIVEGLDLNPVAPGSYFLVCLPLRLTGAEAAPARAILLAEPLVRVSLP